MKQISIGAMALIFTVWGIQAQVVSEDKAQTVTIPLETQKAPKMKSKIMSLVVEVKGEGNRFLADTESLSLVPGRLIPSKGLFIVPELSSVIFRPMPGITVMVMENARLQMKELEVEKRNSKISKRKALLFLNQGTIFVSIQKLNHKITTFQIQTPQGLVSAKGTKFWVSFKDGKGKVGVVNGVVEVKLTSGDKITLKQDQWIDVNGIGPTLKLGAIRSPSPQEREESIKASQEIARSEGVVYSATNPFLTTSEVIKAAQSEVLLTKPGAIPDIVEERLLGGTLSQVAEQILGTTSETPPVTPNPENIPPDPIISPTDP